MTCPLCQRPLEGDTCRPGPGWGRVHRACFALADARSEALELERGALESRLPPALPQRLGRPRKPSAFGVARPRAMAAAAQRLAERGIEVRP